MNLSPDKSHQAIPNHHKRRQSHKQKQERALKRSGVPMTEPKCQTRNLPKRVSICKVHIQSSEKRNEQKKRFPSQIEQDLPRGETHRCMGRRRETQLRAPSRPAARCFKDRFPFPAPSAVRRLPSRRRWLLVGKEPEALATWSALASSFSSSSSHCFGMAPIVWLVKARMSFSLCVTARRGLHEAGGLAVRRKVG